MGQALEKNEDSLEGTLMFCLFQKKQKITIISEMGNDKGTVITSSAMNILPPSLIMEEEFELTPKQLKKVKKIFETHPTLDRIGKTGIAVDKGIMSLQHKIYNKNDVGGLTIIRLPDQKDKFAIYHGEKKGTLLGKGASGAVKIIKNLNTNQYYAVKVYQDGMINHGELNQAILNLVKLDRLIGHYQHNKKIFIIMPLFKGRELAKQIKERKNGEPILLDPSKLLHLATQLTAKMNAFFNEAGLIHRDLKPQNILYDIDTEEVTIIDTDGAVTIEQPACSTASGITNVYLAPEIIASNALDIKKIYDEKNGNTNWYQQGHPEYIKYQAELRARLIFQFNEKTDVYALGLTLGQLFGLTVLRNTVDQFQFLKEAQYDPYLFRKGDVYEKILVIDEKNALLHDRSSLLPESIRGQVINYLYRMTAVDPKDRPTLLEVTQFFKNIEIKFQAHHHIASAKYDTKQKRLLSGEPANTKNKFFSKSENTNQYKKSENIDKSLLYIPKV